MLKTIAHYFGVSYANRRFLDGVIYLHRISDNRITGTAKQNINMFKQFCGTDSFAGVVLATTIWKENEMQDSLRKERELYEEPSYFGDILNGGARLLRHGPFENSPQEEKTSALSILSHVLKQARSRDGHLVLQIQRELIDEQRSLDDTGAGRALSENVRAARDHFITQLKDLQAQWNEQLHQKDMETVRDREEIKRDLKLQIARKEEEDRALMTNLVRMHKEEEERVLSQINRASENWKIELGRKEVELKESENSWQELQGSFQPRTDKSVEREVEDVVKTLRLELVQLRSEFQSRQEKREKVQKAIMFNRTGSAIFNGGR